MPKTKKATSRKVTRKNSDGLEYVIATLPNGEKLKLYGDAVAEAKKRGRPKSGQDKKREPLTLEQAERLTDAILWNCDGGDESVPIPSTPLLLLMDDFADNPDNVESIANTVMRRCYAATMDADTQESAYIERVREQWEKKEVDDAAKLRRKHLHMPQ